jgi:hypothetical protein
VSVRPLIIREHNRAYIAAQVAAAPDGWIVSLREPTRTLEQNARFWAMLTDLSQQKAGGREATPEEWKFLVMNACGFECQFLHSLDTGRPFPVGFRSSALSVREMSTLMDWMTAYGDEQGVVWTEPARAAA